MKIFNTRYSEKDRPIAAEVRDGRLWVTLKDGRIISAPVEWYRLLRGGAPEQWAHVEFSPGGVHWPDLDEDISVRGLLSGSAAPEVHKVSKTTQAA
ncbi:MAG: DUF2442 domain-containing protein [Anaerolineae bacterium]|nr:DUF2442 domain-containing protein [Anaerolineae bacterium]